MPYTEAEQIVAQGARERHAASGTCAPRTRATASRRKENADFQFYATVMFMRETLLK